jgi:hypothetical protein
MKRFNPNKYYRLLHETPSSFAQPTYLGYQLMIQYLNHKYAAEIFREEVPFSGLHQLEQNVYLLNEKIAKARKTQGDYRFAWIPGTSHAINFFYIRENGEEALLYSDSNAPIPGIAKHISKLTGIPVNTTLPNRQADFRSCFIDSLVFGRDITGRNKTGEYRIPNLLSVLKQRATKLSDTSFEVRLPDDLLKTAQLSKFVKDNKEPADRVIHKSEILEQFRARYSQEVLIKGEKKRVSTYLVKKGYKYRDIMEIQFYLNQMSGLSKMQSEAFVREAKALLKSSNRPEWLYEFVTQKAIEFGRSPTPLITPVTVADHNSIVLHEMVSEQTLEDLKAFYESIPKEFRLKLVASPDDEQNTVLHLSCFQNDKFKYLLGSLPNEQRVVALTVKGDQGHTVLHWLTSQPHLLEFALKNIPIQHRLQALTTPDQYGYTVLHWIEAEPESLRLTLSLLPQKQILEALTVAVKGNITPLHWLKTKPTSVDVVLSCLPEVERSVLKQILEKDLPPSCAQVRAMLRKGMPKGETLSFTSNENEKLNQLKELVASATKSYNEYSNNISFSLFHHHGRAGRARATEFIQNFSVIESYDEALNTLLKFLKNSKNGNTHPHSYRTMLLHTLSTNKEVEGNNDAKALKETSKRFLSLTTAFVEQYELQPDKQSTNSGFPAYPAR